MPCNCRKFAPKGKKASAPKNVKTIKKMSTSASNQAAGYAKKYGIKVPKVTAAKPQAKKVGPRVAHYQKIEAKRLAKENANPCKCTPGKP